MHAIVVTTPGDADVLAWQEVPDPVAGPGEVIVDVAAAAVNRADLLQRQGLYPPPPGAPEWLGLECSGTVSERGRRRLQQATQQWTAWQQLQAVILPELPYSSEPPQPQSLQLCQQRFRLVPTLSMMSGLCWNLVL